MSKNKGSYPENLITDLLSFNSDLNLFDSDISAKDIISDPDRFLAFNEAMASLDKRPHDIILLYYEQHMTMTEIGSKLNISATRVGQLIRKTLRQLLARDNFKRMEYGYKGYEVYQRDLTETRRKMRLQKQCRLIHDFPALPFTYYKNMFDNRTYNALSYYELATNVSLTMGTLAALSDETILSRIRCIGKESLQKIRNVIDELNHQYEKEYGIMLGLKVNRTEMEREITTTLRKSVSDDYTSDILSSMSIENNDKRTLMDDIVDDIVLTSGYAEDGHYNEDDIKLAIGRVLKIRLCPDA